MTKWLKSLSRCCRHGRPQGVHALDPDNHDTGLQQPRRRTYYYSIFAARLAIMIMLAILIALLTILTWHFTTVYTTRSIKNLAFSLRTELLNRPIARMWNLLNCTVDTTLTQVNLAEYVLGQHSLPIDTTTQVQVYQTMRNLTWAVFAARGTAKSITVAYRNGQLQSFDRDAGSNQTYYVYTEPLNGTSLGNNTISPQAPAMAPASGPDGIWPDLTPGNGSTLWYIEPVNAATGNPIAPPTSMPAYDLSRALPSVLAQEPGEVTWSVTVSDLEVTPLLTGAAAVRHPATGTSVAVAGVTTDLSSINAFLQQLTVSHSGYLYLTTADGYLLATSTNASLVSSGPTRTLVLANESSDPVMSAGAQWLFGKYGTDGLLQNVVHAEDIVLDGHGRFYIDTFALELPSLNMIGVILTPRSYVMGEVDRRGRATLAILIAISSCILVVGCIFILILTSGVSTEMKLRAELINHLDARRRAEASSNYKSQFLANMSHELRTPMAAVIGLLDILLCDDCLSAEQVNMVSQIRRCSTALLRLLNNILDISKVESGKLLLEEADFDLNRELEGLVDMFSVQCIDHDIEIVLDLADDMPRMVRGDSARTLQIFANLIANSVKFTSSGHVILRGWCGSLNVPASTLKNGLLFGKENNSWNHSKLGLDIGGPPSVDSGKILLWFEVEDTGCGIDPSKWEAVFDSFVQADPSTTRTYGGTGLGLCIVRSLVRKMEGDIKVVKKQGPGTLVRFYLVFGQPSEKEPDTPHLSVPTELENAKVLLSMKGDVGRGTLSQWMHYKGLQVYEASEWDETIQLLQGLLEEEQKVDWRSNNGQDMFDIHEATYRKVGNLKATFPEGHINNVPDDEVSLVLSGNPAQWNLRYFKVLVVLDSELFSGEASLDVESMLAVLDEFRDKGVLISWLLSHDTPNTFKTQLRKTGYSITTNQPLYKSKLLQLLTAMVGCLNCGIRDNSHKFEARVYKPEYEDGKAAALDSRVLESLQPKVQSKLGVPVMDKSLPKMLEKWSSLKDLANLEKSQIGYSRCGQTGLALDIIALHQDPDRYTVTKKCLEPSTSPLNRPGDIRRGPMSQEQEMINLAPSASPGSSGPGSSRSLGGLPTLYPTSIESDMPSSTPSSNSFESVHSNHVVDVPQVLHVPSVHSLTVPINILDSLEEARQHGTKASDYTSKHGLNHDGSHKPETIVGTGDGGKNETPQSSEEVVDQKHVVDSTGLVVGHVPPVKPMTTDSTGGSEGIVNSPPLPQPAAPAPLETRPSARKAPFKKPQTSRLGPSNALIGVRILLAEDTPVLQKVATIMLEKMGARVVAVNDGLQAVETIEKSRGDVNALECMGGITHTINGRDGANEEFDLVLMDCQMPRMDGYDATRAIRKAEEGKDWHIPIVALTAHAMSSDEAKCLQVGMDAYLTKPIDSKLMVSTILSLTKKGG